MRYSSIQDSSLLILDSSIFVVKMLLRCSSCVLLVRRWTVKCEEVRKDDLAELVLSSAPCSRPRLCSLLWCGSSGQWESPPNLWRFHPCTTHPPQLSQSKHPLNPGFHTSLQSNTILNISQHCNNVLVLKSYYFNNNLTNIFHDLYSEPCLLVCHGLIWCLLYISCTSSLLIGQPRAADCNQALWLVDLSEPTSDWTIPLKSQVSHQTRLPPFKYCFEIFSKIGSNLI